MSNFNLEKTREKYHSLPTKIDKMWFYHEYYFGDKDQDKRRNGYGENHWTRAESIEWYTGRFVRDMMHGNGEYRWRYNGPSGEFVTYEGYFYANAMHGYGVMSYPDGRTFKGIFCNNVRWGPGVESQAYLREDVGLWRGLQLIRLSWQPSVQSIAPDLCIGNNGRSCVEPHRIMLSTTTNSIGEVNSAIELLKQCGAKPIVAVQKWSKLYSKYCTDLKSQLCNTKVFQHEYYKGKISTLEEVDRVPEIIDTNVEQDNRDTLEDMKTYFAWNNNKMIVHMMKHCYMHEEQRSRMGIDLQEVLIGPRNTFKPAAKHEIDCRTVLMACYLGNTASVIQLINEHDVCPDIADIQGNSALMYAACGDQTDIAHFLVEAGANVDSYNDSCCTPLGVSLIRFACIQNDVSATGMVQSLLPPPIVPPPPSTEQRVFEWNISRDIPLPNAPTTFSKTGRSMSSKKVKSLTSLKDTSTLKKKFEVTAPLKAPADNENDSDDSKSEDKAMYIDIKHEYLMKMNDIIYISSSVNPPQYMFEFSNMVAEIDSNEEDQKKVVEKTPKKILSKTIKTAMKPSKEIIWQSGEKDEFASIDSAEKLKIDLLARIMLTILQLLSDGADPLLVRCPQPALVIAIVSGSPDLVRHLINYGADVNEVYPQILGYTALDIAVSRKFTSNNFDLIQTLLEGGADTNHRLQYNDPEILGPTLFHAILARKTENEIEDDIREKLLQLLLEYNCDPTVKFKGRSPIDVAMSKSLDLLEIFIKSPKTNLNCYINDLNQTILIKMFTLQFVKNFDATERLQTLTNLLLFGADPLIECQDGEEKYANIFVFAKNILTELENTQVRTNSPQSAKNEKGKKPDKTKKDDKVSVAKMSSKSVGKMAVDTVTLYKEVVELATECARLLHIRWLQANLVKELIKIIDKYKHRQWNMILKEHKQKKRVRLWLTGQRCLEIWDILKTTKRKLYKNNRILKYLLCIVQYYSYKSKEDLCSSKLTAECKDMIESDVSYLLHEHKMAEMLASEIIPWNRPYVKPELAIGAEEKFNVCFECALPFNEEKILCSFCKMISFCSLNCIENNIPRCNCHPCSPYLKEKYFPSPSSSITNTYDSG